MRDKDLWSFQNEASRSVGAVSLVVGLPHVSRVGVGWARMPGVMLGMLSGDLRYGDSEMF